MIKSKFIGNLARISCILEISVEKPGNVSPSHDFGDTLYANFVYGSILIGNAVEKAFVDGYKGKILIGKRIYDYMKETKIFNKTNTHFGTALLFIPVANALGFFLKENLNNRPNYKISELRNFIDYVLRKTTTKDAIYLYNAFKIFKIGGIENYKGNFNILSKNFKNQVLKNNINFYDLMEMTKNDLIAKELTTKMEISFYALSKFKENLKIENDERKAILRTYITLLSEFTDSFIEKKYGIEIAKKIREKAKKIRENFDKKNIKNFAEYLYKNNINPGAIADIINNTLFLYFLEKFKCLNF